jgi:hypothetical protein
MLKAKGLVQLKNLKKRRFCEMYIQRIYTKYFHDFWVEERLEKVASVNIRGSTLELHHDAAAGGDMGTGGG